MKLDGLIFLPLPAQLTYFKRYPKLVQNHVLKPFVLLPPLIHKQSEEPLSSYMVTLTIVYKSNKSLQQTTWWQSIAGERKHCSSLCCIYFSVFFFIIINSTASLSKQLKELSAVAKMQKIQVEQKGFILHPEWPPLRL